MTLNSGLIFLVGFFLSNPGWSMDPTGKCREQLRFFVENHPGAGGKPPPELANRGETDLPLPLLEKADQYIKSRELTERVKALRASPLNPYDAEKLNLALDQWGRSQGFENPRAEFTAPFFQGLSSCIFQMEWAREADLSDSEREQLADLLEEEDHDEKDDGRPPRGKMVDPSCTGGFDDSLSPLLGVMNHLQARYRTRAQCLRAVLPEILAAKGPLDPSYCLNTLFYQGGKLDQKFLSKKLDQWKRHSEMELSQKDMMERLDPENIFLVCDSRGNLVSLGELSHGKDYFHVEILVTPPHQKPGGLEALEFLMKRALKEHQKKMTLASLSTSDGGTIMDSRGMEDQLTDGVCRGLP